MKKVSQSNARGSGATRQQVRERMLEGAQMRPEEVQERIVRGWDSTENLKKSLLEGRGLTMTEEKSFEGLPPEDQGLTTEKKARHCNDM